MGSVLTRPLARRGRDGAASGEGRQTGARGWKRHCFRLRLLSSDSREGAIYPGNKYNNRSI